MMPYRDNLIDLLKSAVIVGILYALWWGIGVYARFAG